MKKLIEQAMSRSIAEIIPFFIDKLLIMEEIDSNTSISQIANETKLRFGKIEMSLKDVKKKITDEQAQQLKMCKMHKSVTKK